MSVSQRRVHSPSLPDIWVPTRLSSTDEAQYSPSASRPSLPTIDVASKSAAPLTPPLTPASTRASDSDLSDSRSSRSNSVDLARPKTPPAPLQWRAPCMHGPYTHSKDRNTAASFSMSVLPSPISPVRPRHARPNLELNAPSPARFLFVSGVPPAASSDAIRQAFADYGHLKGIFVGFQLEHGIVILAFFDVRHTIRALSQITSCNFFDGHQLQCRFICSDELRQLIGQSNFINQNEGELFISTSFVGQDGDLDTTALQNVLASFGDLRSFTVVDAHARTFHLEYFDARDALSAYTSLNSRVILGVRLHLSLPDNNFQSLLLPPIEPSHTNAIPFPSAESPVHSILQQEPDTPAALQHPQSEEVFRPRPRAHSICSPDPEYLHAQMNLSSFTSPSRSPPRSPSKTPTPTPHPRVKTPPEHVHARRISNIYHFDSVGRTMVELPRTMPPRPRSISVSSDTDSPVAGRLVLPPSPNANSGALSLPQSPALSQEPVIPDYQQLPPLDVTRAEMYASEQYRSLSSDSYTNSLARLFQSARPSRILGSGLGLNIPTEKEKDALPERNKIDIGKIERGEETRTTVMIKNIPNKMSDENLIEFINQVCPRKIDFLYLRMDFNNGCNVGYAFVNFIHVEDLLRFAKAKLGTKWNMFSSEKVLGMSYANLSILGISRGGTLSFLRGKEALIDKFRSSSIMDQREAWRPKLFYSSGLNQGLLEEWPSPTHIRRKERSNFFPSKLHQSRTLFHHPHMRG